MEYLDLDTLKSLRLSTRQLCAECTGPRFERFIRNQTVELTTVALQSLRELSLHPKFGAIVENLRIMATVYDQTRQLSLMNVSDHARQEPTSEKSHAQARDDLAWLREQQNHQDELSYDEAVDHLAFCLKLMAIGA